MSYILKNINELKEISSKGNLIIVGAGKVALVLIQYIFTNKLCRKIICIAVSCKNNNPDEILGVPVVSIDELKEFSLDTKIIIATMENLHGELENTIDMYRFDSVYLISNTLYALLRCEIPNLQPELIQITGKIKSLQEEIANSNKKLSEKLRRLENIIFDGKKYEELINPVLYKDELCKWYMEHTQKELDLLNPKTFNEKIQWFKLYGINELVTRLSDKYAVREWIAEKIGEEYLVPLLGVWDSIDQIDFNVLPDKFVIKCNHGCGMNIVVQNKNTINMFEVQASFAEWMNTNFAYKAGFELQYRNIQKKIIAEQYLENIDGDLYDYKFWCFSGKVEFVMFLSDRRNGIKMNNYDKKWRLLPFTYNYPNSTKDVKRPVNLEKMIHLAEQLAKGFPFVRVDFYHLEDGTIKFGEMTFTPASGICKWSNDKIDKHLGDLIKL